MKISSEKLSRSSETQPPGSILTEDERTRLSAINAELARREAETILAPDEFEFIRSLSIEDKVGGRLIPFHLWGFQRDYIGELRAHDRLLALKARQLGITWTTLAHMLYEAEFWGDRLFLILSQSGEDAIDALHRVRILYNSQSEKSVRLTKDNTEEIAFSNGSRFRSMKATKRAGRSQAAYAALADEFATWDWPDEQLASLEGCQRLYAVFTGQGPGDLAHAIWTQAQQGIGEWHGVFYPWHAHPGRDAEWYQKKVIENASPRLARREYAATPADAFAAPSGVFFERWSERNVLAGFTAEPTWPTVRCADFGRRHPAALWIQTSPQGQPIIVAEYAPAARDTSAAMTTQEFADQVKRIDAELGLDYPPSTTFCDPAGKAVEATTGKSEFEIFAANGLYPQGESSSIRDGCVCMFNLIADPDLPLLVSDRCPWLTEALTAVPPDKGKPDLYDQRESSPYQHILDALRYWAVNHRQPSTGAAVASGQGRATPVF